MVFRCGTAGGRGEKGGEMKDGRGECRGDGSRIKSGMTTKTPGMTIKKGIPVNQISGC